MFLPILKLSGLQVPLSEIPIKVDVNTKIISKIVDKIISNKNQNKSTVAFEKEIDNLVYNLYELTYDEVKVIDPEFSLTKKEYEAIKLE